MTRIYVSLMIVFLLLAGPRVQVHSEQPTLEDGAYLVLREGSNKEDVLPIEPNERLAFHDYRFQGISNSSPPRHLALQLEPYVPLILDSDPEPHKDDTDRTWKLGLSLAEEHAKALERLTAENLGANLAIVIGGEVVITPTIRAAIPGGKIMISRCTDDACEILLPKLRKKVRQRNSEDL